MTTTIRTHIYVVDDDASVRRSLARVVRSAGHNAFAFASAEDFFASDYRTGELEKEVMQMLNNGSDDAS
jgi:FixJ family two-component response regulator